MSSQKMLNICNKKRRIISKSALKITSGNYDWNLVIHINYSRKWTKTYTLKATENKAKKKLKPFKWFHGFSLTSEWTHYLGLENTFQKHRLDAKHESSCTNKIRINVSWHWIHIGLLNIATRFRHETENSPMNVFPWAFLC